MVKLVTLPIMQSRDDGSTPYVKELEVKKAKGGEYAPRDKPKKRPGKHKKSKSKSEKLNNKHKKYKGQGK